MGELSTTSLAIGVPGLLSTELIAGELVLLEDPSCKMRESLLRCVGLDGVVGSIVNGNRCENA